MARLLRIVRSEGSKELIKFLKVFEDCTSREFKSVIQYLFGNPATTGCAQILTDSLGNKTMFEQLVSGKTYFITFEKKDVKSLLTWEGTIDIVPLINSSKIKILDQSEYFDIKITEARSSIKDKATELLIRTEDSLFTLQQSLKSIHNTLGSQSLRVIEYNHRVSEILAQLNYLAPILQKNTQELKVGNEELRRVYKEIKDSGGLGREKKQLSDTRILNYMKNFNYKDVPMKELTPAEMKRFMKFQMIMENKIQLTPSQNTPLARGKLKVMNRYEGVPLKK